MQIVVKSVSTEDKVKRGTTGRYGKVSGFSRLGFYLFKVVVERLRVCNGLPNYDGILECKIEKDMI